MGGSGSGRETPTDPSKEGYRPRSGSDSQRSPVSKVMDMFRSRSHSVNEQDKRNKVSIV